ncbi:NUDIX domain-containing protein [Frankia sp. R82]|uniref:NUDIX domain-containing protein n=1 Tax=Frankia sp. R82 TaxID=2950553 RepID=UPI002044A8CC|nr:NUDIX domain-containing protein [Frankia sp. R82]MCM3883537.1 NUDIX domain-containing protein [Frankia sp. R82]
MSKEAVAKEATATVFVFRRGEDAAWQVAMMWHPRFGGWLPPGGHVEAYESAAEAAVREVEEELGCRVRLVAGLATPLPDGFPHRPVIAPWWIVEMAASPDNHCAARHVHVDHVFVAFWDGDVELPETQVRWFDERQLADAADVAEDSKLQAKELFGRIGDVAQLAHR